MQHGLRWAMVAALAAAAVTQAATVTVGHSADRPLRAGDTLTVVATAPPNSQAVIRILALDVDIPMTESRNGQYRGTYVVRATDQLNGQSVQVIATEPNGNVWRGLAPNAIGEPALANPNPPPLPPVGPPNLPNYPPLPTVGTLQVTRFSVNPHTWATVGTQIQFDVVATPGCVATVAITGIVKDMVLNERATGQYSGVWTVPNQALSTARTTATLRLRLGTESQLFISADMLGFDTLRPTLVDQSPLPESISGGALNQVVLVFDDGGGSGLDLASVQASIDGVNVAPTAQLIHNVLVLRPAQPLPPGRHQVRAVVQDLAGNQSVPVVTNFVSRGGGGVVDNGGLVLTHSANGRLQQGDIIRVQLSAPANGRAVYSIGRTVTNRPLTEIRPGLYTADYLVEARDRFWGETVTATFVSFEGVRSTVTAANPIGGGGGGRDRTPGGLGAPRILSLNNGDTVPERTALRGTSRAGATVNITITSATDMGGVVTIRGNTVEVQAVADADGNWTSPTVSFSKPVVGGRTTYTITATAAHGAQTSDPTVVTVSR